MQMALLATQSTTIKRILHDPGRRRIILVSANGADIYSVDDWSRLAWVAMGDITCGAINTNGIYLGTSDAGVYRLPFTASGASTSSLIRVFGPGAAVELASANIVDLSGHGTALAIATASELVYLPTPVVGYAYTGSGTPLLCAINDTYLAWATSAAVGFTTLPTDDFVAAETTIIVTANALVFETGTDNLMISHSAGLMLVDAANPPVGEESTDDLSDEPTTSAEWTYSNQGGSGSHSQTGGIVVLTPQQNVNNSVAMRRTADSHTSVKVRGKMVSDGTNATRLLNICIGSGAIVDMNDGGTTKWWNTTLEAGYTIMLLDKGSSTGILLAKRPGSVGAFIDLGSGQAPSDWDTAYHDYELRIAGGRVQVYVDDVLRIDVEDSSYQFGDILIAQGEYVDGRGAIGNIDSITWTTPGGGGTDYAEDLGTVTDCKSAWKTGDLLAYGTSDGSAGGRFGVLDISDPESIANKNTAAGDCSAVWIDETLTTGLHDNTLERYRLIAEISPAANAAGVRRDWTLYAEITDALGGIETGTVALTVNGTSQTPTVAAITNGFAVTYTPPGNSGYGERVTIVVSGTDSDGQTVSRSWAFTTAGVPALTATDASPPNVVCIRDISLSLAESDETVDGVNVVWLETHTSPLIVTEAQAKEVGRVKIDETTYHKHKVGVRVLATDAGTLQTRDLRPGSIATITCAALGMTAQKCEILAAQRTIDDSDEDISFDLQAAYYEEV
jgi:hypothetical protein